MSIIGGGEMGNAIRANQWNSSPIGSPDSWPASLKNVLNIILAARTPMCIAWGPQFIQFYNDSFLPILGSKHPAFGTRACTTFSEIWQTLQPIFDTVMSGESVALKNFLLPLNRFGYIEECYFDMSFSPVPGDDQLPGGVLLTAIETTSTLLAERRLSTLRDLATRATAIHTGSDAINAVISVIQENSFDFASALFYSVTDEGLLQLAANIRMDADDRVPPIIDVRGENAAGIIGQVFRDCSSSRILTNPYGGGREFIAGHWMEPVTEGYITAITRPGRKQCHGVLLIGINPRKRLDDDYEEFLRVFADHAARALDTGDQVILHQQRTESEARYRALIEGSPIAIFTCDKDGTILLYNSAVVELFGNVPEQGKNRWYPGGVLLDLNGERIPIEESPMSMAVKNGRIVPGRELLVRRKDNSIRRILPNPQTLYDAAGNVSGAINVVIDITQQRESQQRLSENQERLRMAMEATRLGTWDFEPATGKLYWSDECRQIYDLPPGHTIDFEFFEKHIYPEDRSQALAAINRALAGDSDGNFDARYRIIRYSDQKVRWIRSQGKVYFDDAKKPSLFIGTVLDITRDQMREQQLVDNLGLFKKMADDVPVMIWITDKDGSCTYLNQQWFSFTGQDRKMAMGDGWLSCVHPDDMRESQRLFEEASNAKQSFAYTYRLRQANGQYRWCSDAGTPRFDEEGNFEGFIGTVIDIHEDKIAEENSARLAAIVQSTDDAIISKNLSGIITSWNNGASKLFGYEEQEMVGESIMKLIPADRLEEEPRILERIHAGERIESFETKRLRKDGTLVDLSLTISPLFDRNNRIIGASKIARDITSQVQARQQLEDAESRLRLAAEGTGLATWDLDLVTHEIIYSPRINQIFGYPPGTAVTHRELRSHLHQDDLPKVQLAFANALINGIYDYEARIMRADNREIWIRTQGNIIFDERRKPLRMLGTMRDITDQKNSQQILQDSESRLNIAIEAAELGTWEFDINTMVTKVSARFKQIFGFDDDSEPGHAEITDRIHPDDVATRNAAHDAALQTGVLDNECRIIRPDGAIRFIKEKGKVFFNDIDEPQRILGTVMDITEQRENLHRLQESEVRFRTIANTAPVMIWMSGDDHFSDFFNTSWLNFTGRTTEQEVGDGWLENVHPEDVTNCRRIYDEAFNSKKSFHVEYRLRRADGQYRWVSDNAVPRYDGNDHFIGFISACMDIDDAKRFNEDLGKSELLLKTITNVSPVALWMTNPQGENTFVNDTWLKWTGMTEETLKNNGWVHAVIEADKNYTLRLFKKRSANFEKFSSEFRFKVWDGSIRWGLSEGFPYYTSNGIFAGYAGSVTDITERKLDEFRKNEFLAVASHELKTPLTSIKAYAQLLGNTYKASGDTFLRNALTKVDNQVNRMTKLVADFLNLSKIESDKFQLELEPFYIDALISEVVSDVQMVSPTHEIIIDAPSSVMVEADREKIAQVLTNFLTNAVKYSPGRKEVAVSLTTTDEAITVAVRDQGIGIPENEHEKIFQRFYRAGANNIQFSGFGIGLYISAEIINRHSGEIGVQSSPETGSVFYFRLPRNLEVSNE